MQTRSATLTSWRSDHSNSRLRFQVPYLGIGRISGVFREHRATIDIDETGPRSVEIEVDAASVDSNDEVRDHLIRSMDFLGVDAHPTIRYQSTGIAQEDDGSYTVDGGLSVNGVTHQVRFRFDLSGPVEASGGQECLAVHATGYVSRMAFGLRAPNQPATRALPDADLVEIQAWYTMVQRLL